jgi:hypothetical protein
VHKRTGRAALAALQDQGWFKGNTTSCSQISHKVSDVSAPGPANQCGFKVCLTGCKVCFSEPALILFGTGYPPVLTESPELPIFVTHQRQFQDLWWIGTHNLDAIDKSNPAGTLIEVTACVEVTPWSQATSDFNSETMFAMARTVE